MISLKNNCYYNLWNKQKWRHFFSKSQSAIFVTVYKDQISVHQVKEKKLHTLSKENNNIHPSAVKAHKLKKVLTGKVTLLITFRQSTWFTAISPTKMSFPPVIAAFHALFDVIGLPGNLLVIVTIILESRFHVMRYILLESLALSDFLLLVLVSSFRIKSIAQERWLYGQKMCYLNSFFIRYLYINTVLHLLAVSYDRYLAIVKSSLTYDGTITKTKVVCMFLIWIIPIPLSIGPFLGWGKYVYNPEVFFCEQGWAENSESYRAERVVFPTATLVIPFLIIVLLNASVYKTAKRQINAIEVQVGGPVDTENPQQQEIVSRRLRDRKAAVDVSIIIAAFLVCFLPVWVTGICRQFVPGIDIPAEAVLSTTCIFFLSAICNPIIYSIRKREFRKAVKKMFRSIGVCLYSNDNDIV